MSGAIFTILDEQDDAKLCARLADFLERKYRNKPRVNRIPHERRVVVLGWKVLELVGTGGFQRLLETRIPGDGHLALTKEALDAVGYRPVSDTLNDLFSVFPNARPQRSREERSAWYLQHSHGIAFRDSKFQAETGEFTRRLAEFIRTHRETIAAKDRRRTPKVSFSRLPHWARVAFAAQCAKIVYPLLLKCWPNLMPKRRLAIQRAIHVAAKSAICGQIHAGVDGAIVNASMAAGAAHGGMTANDKEPRPATGLDRTVASFAAKAAEKAANTARAPIAESEAALDEAYRFARSAAVASDHPKLTRRFKRAFLRLRKLADLEHWTNETPISRELWEKL